MIEGFAILTGVLFLGTVYYYNSLTVQRNRIDTAWSKMEVQLKKRYSLLPELVETIRVYAKHEKLVFKEATKARVQMAKVKTVKEQEKAQNLMTLALRSLFEASEKYPKLEKSKKFLILQEELARIENRIANSRQEYNREVLKYDNSLEKTPSKLIGKLFGFQAKEYFEMEESSKRTRMEF